MSVRIVLLCEDAATDRFVRRFLSKRNFNRRDIQTLPFTSGSAEYWVRKRYPNELKAIRSWQNAFLIVVIDADTHTTQARRSQLDDECRNKKVPVREPKDPVIIIVPRRNIETWFAYLKGCPVDEKKKYPRRTPTEQRFFADKLYRMCHEAQKLRPPVPPSLDESCQEYRKLER